MDNLNICTIPKDLLIKAGNMMGIKANSLIKLTGINESQEKIEPDEEWKGLIKTLLNPMILGGIIQVVDDELTLSNLVADNEKALLYGEDNENYNVIEFSPIDIVYYLDAYIGEIEEETKISQSLSLNGVITLFALVDSIKRMKLTNLLDPSIVDMKITKDVLEVEYFNSKSYSDFRWLGPLVGELRWEDKEADFKKGLEELVDINLIKFQGEVITVEGEEQVFFHELLGNKKILGIRSTFYQEGDLSYLALVIIETKNFIWYLDVMEDTSLISIDSDEVRSLIATILASGEVPSIEQKQRFCTRCGTKLNEEAKFCVNCGAKI